MTPVPGATYLINGEMLICKTVRPTGIHTFEISEGERRNQQGHIVCWGIRLIRQEVFEAEAVEVKEKQLSLTF